MRAHRQICTIQPKQTVNRGAQGEAVLQKDNLVIWYSASSLLSNSYQLEKKCR